MSACLHCGRPMRPRGARRTDAPGTLAPKARGLCTSCHRHHRDDYDPARRPPEDVLAEVEFAAGLRTPHELAAALGIQLDSIARAALRAGRPDIARTYWRAATTPTRRTA